MRERTGKNTATMMIRYAIESGLTKFGVTSSGGGAAPMISAGELISAQAYVASVTDTRGAKHIRPLVTREKKDEKKNRRVEIFTFGMDGKE